VTPTLQKTLTLGRLALQFSRVERVTKHEDGIRPETDADHTIMLGLIAGELADLFKGPYRVGDHVVADAVVVHGDGIYKGPHVAFLDPNLVVAFALVHDFIETYTGDVQTQTIGAEGRAAKRARERAAETQLHTDLGTESESWVVRMVIRYEEQMCPEARFVRLLDKVMPKITHAFNGCIAARALTDYPGFVKAHQEQHEQLSKAYPEFPEILELLQESMEHAQDLWICGLCGEPADMHGNGIVPGDVFLNGFGIVSCVEVAGMRSSVAPQVDVALRSD